MYHCAKFQVTCRTLDFDTKFAQNLKITAFLKKATLTW